MWKTKIGSADVKGNLEAKLLNTLINQETEYTRILYFGQVVSNTDSKNINRIKVRIPLIDDVYYKNATKEQGDSKLPWCLPISQRFIEAPETNNIVLVLLTDPKTPFFGRIYFDCITDLSATDLFERLTPEEKSLSNWLNAENTIEVNIPKPVDPQKYNVTATIKKKVGVRGKDNNKLELDVGKTLLVQNYKNRTKESFLELSEDSTLESANELHLLSKKGKQTEYNPVFDDPLFQYLDKQNNLFKKIIILLNSVPAISPVGPCTAGPSASQLVSEFVNLKTEFLKLKKTGSSEKLFIN